MTSSADSASTEDRLSAGTPQSMSALVAAGTEARLSVLVVDDEATVRAVTVEMLDACGYRTSSATSAAAVLALYDERQPDPDLLLIDLSMPGMTGPELVDCLGPRLRGTVVVYMTGYVDPDEATDLQARHGAKILSKPFTLRSLIDVMADARARVVAKVGGS